MKIEKKISILNNMTNINLNNYCQYSLSTSKIKSLAQVHRLRSSLGSHSEPPYSANDCQLGYWDLGNDLNIYQVSQTPKGLDWKLVPEVSSLKSKVLFSDSNILDFTKFYSSSSTKEKEILLGVRDILVEELQHDYPEEYQNLFDFLYIVRQFIFSQGFLKNRIDKHEKSGNWKKIKDKYGNYYNQHWKPFDIIKDLVLMYHSCSHLWDKKYNSKPLQKLNSLKKSLKRPTNMKDVRDIEKFNSITLKSLIETIEEYQDKQKQRNQLKCVIF